MSKASTPGVASPDAPRAGDEPAWVDDVIGYWLRDRDEAQWFTRDPVLDADIRARFGALHAQLARDPVAAPRSPREALATLIVLDQFSRNLFRDDRRAFAGDVAARRIASDALEAGWQAGMSAREGLFLSLPFEHSESLADQTRAVALTRALGNESWMHFARQHYDIIARFGRFPHRNATLGRASTAEELAFLVGSAGGF